MKTLFSLAGTIGIFLLVLSCNQPSKGTESENQKQKNSTPVAEAKYICPMKCEGSGSENPGKCGVCGMDLLEAATLKGAEKKTETNTH